MKLLDYRERWSWLEEQDNPFATVVMAHLKTQETRKDPAERKRWKISLMRRLYERGYSKKDIIYLFKFIDWLMLLPAELEEEFLEEVETYKEGGQMTYVTSAERRGIKRGKEQGQWEELLASIEMMLDLKFGSEGLALMPEIEQIEDIAIMRTIRSSIKSASTPDELRVHFPAPQSGKINPRLQRMQQWMVEQGQCQGLLEGIALALRLKFGAAGQELMAEIATLEHPKVLQEILQRVETATTLAEVREVYDYLFL